ncbi:dipeptidase [Chloroflexota bacterium]
MVQPDKATRLHAESIIIDGLEVNNWDSPDIFSDLCRGGLTAVNATIAVWENFTETLNNIARWYPRFEKYADMIMPVKSVADINRAKAAGKCGIIFGFQNSNPVEDGLQRLSIFYDLGVRIIQITYNNSNFVGSGYLDSPDYGLSNFGIDFIAECNRLGIAIDCSHVGYKTTMDAIKASAKPIFFTHAGPRVLCDHPRNKTDEQLKALAAKGGMAGANIYPYFLASGNKATLSDFIDTVDYMVNLIGIDHVGIGSDFTQGQSPEWYRWLFSGRNIDREPRYQLGIPVYPKGIETASDFPNLTRALLERGYPESDVKKIMGANFLRLFGEVWA